MAGLSGRAVFGIQGVFDRRPIGLVADRIGVGVDGYVAGGDDGVLGDALLPVVAGKRCEGRDLLRVLL
jgi:hypothetical protein